MGASAAKTVISWTDRVGNDHDGPLITRVEGYDIIACAVCGFRHVLPLPEPETLERAYREAYCTEEKPEFHAVEDQEWAELSQRDRLESFERLLPVGRRRLLDVGAGSGFFLKTAAERGWRVLGLEPSPQAVVHGRSLGINMLEGFFNAETAANLGRFDVVHLNNVLEQVPNPLRVVALARDLLATGGLLCLDVPSDFAPLQMRARAAPHHLNYFDFDSLADLVTRLGFETPQRSTSFPMELFLLMGLDYTKDGELGLDLALERAGFQETRRKFYRALADAGLGREAVVIAVKK
jgi:SAM-dependent methyltransferase